MTNFIKLPNWEKFQGWRQRKGEKRPEWVKLHATILYSHHWVANDSDVRVLMITLLALAGANGNRIPDSPEYIARMSHLSTEAYERAINILLAEGFVELTDDPEQEPVVDRLEREPRQRRQRPVNKLKNFEKFWNEYPKRRNRKDAEWIWQREDLDEIADEIIAVVKAYAKTNDWTKDGGKFVPLPTTFLNQERWKDEIQSNTTAQRHDISKTMF